ncbi:alpha/beta hydrolase [Kitasatospora purpeofusca]|uniref:alpha/beta fold hydrolase n=1 Tax=Kitasatospora purpeofusca TaxID=67352 RepID=UPI0033FB68AF
MQVTELLQLPDKGTQLHYEVHGDDGPWLVLVSGLGGHGAFWSAQVEHFSKTHRVVIFDHRGHGASTGGDERSGVSQCSEDLGALIEELGAERIRLVGHSMGGMIVQRFVLTHPEKVEALVISGSGARLDVRARLLMEFRRKVLLELGREDFCRLQTIISVGEFPPETNEDMVIAMEAVTLSRLPPSDLISARISSITEFDSSSDLPKVTTPTLILSSRDDHTAPPAGGEDLHRLIPLSQYKLVSSGGHFFPRVNPTECNELLEDFFTERRK